MRSRSGRCRKEKKEEQEREKQEKKIQKANEKQERKIQEEMEKQETTASIILVLILEPQRKAHCKGVKPVSTEDEFLDVTWYKSLKSFPPCYSQSPLITDFILTTIPPVCH